MNIFLTGATGLVGSQVAQLLLSDGYRVKALRRPGSTMSLLGEAASRIEWYEGDLLDIPTLEAAIAPGDAIVHAAAVVSFHAKDQAALLKNNIEGTANLVNVALGKGVERFIHLSSVAALGRKKDQYECDENVKWEQSSLNTVYAKSKYHAEQEVWRGAAEGLKVVILNPSVVLGVGDWQRSSTQLFRYVYEGKRFYPPGSINYVDVRDVAAVILAFLRREPPQEAARYILNAGAVPYQEFFAHIARAFQRPAPPFKVSALMAEIAWRAAALWAFVSGSVPFVSKETARLSQRHYYYQNEKIKKELNFHFRTLEETTAWACEALLKKYGH